MYGLVKTLDDGQGNKIKLVGNALTFVLYKSYFGRDLLNDIVLFAKKSADSETVRKLGSLNIKTEDDLDGLSTEEREKLFESIGEYNFDTEFILNFIATLIATAEYPNKSDVAELIMQIPPWWIADRKIISELMELLSMFITDKNKATNIRGGL
ncbi:MAG: hypothetical protein ACOX24_01240 [Christensenellales bacterium]|jgi:hypothetical protein